MKKKDLCAEFKAALEKEYGWKILKVEEDDFYFKFSIAEPEMGFFWNDEEEDLPEGSTYVGGLTVDGFGGGIVQCRMPIHRAVSAYLLETELPLEDKARTFFSKEYGGILEVLSIEKEEENDWHIETVLVRTRLPPGKAFDNKYALVVHLVESDTIVFQIEDSDIDEFMVEEE